MTEDGTEKKSDLVFPFEVPISTWMFHGEEGEADGSCPRG